MSDALPPLAPDTSRLLDEEREIPAVPTVRRERIRGRLHAALAAAPPPTPTLGRSWASHAITAAVALGVGLAAGAWLHSRYAAAPPTPAPSAPPAPSRDVELPAPPDPAPAADDTAEPTTVGSRGAAQPETRPPGAPRRHVVPRRPGTLLEEGRLLDAARGAMANGRGAEALDFLDRHAATHPDGELAEEREVLAVRALVQSGNRRAAETRAHQFRVAYPNSLLRSAVERSLETGGERPTPPAGPP